MKRLFILLLSFFAFTIVNAQPNAWINEIHYDNTSTDVNEAIEVVIENTGSYNLSDFAVDLYNGNGGVTYNTTTLDNFTAGNTEGNYTFYYFVYPVNGIQNGAPDGLCLSYQSVLVTGQFLSYEGTLTATDGPANGLTSIDIGVSEGSNDVGTSLQLSGTGVNYTDFTWQAPATATLGALNNGQVLAAPGDQTSTVTAPTVQLVAGTISSIGTDSVPVLRFDIKDAASGDGLPTVVTGVYFVAGPNNTLDFQNNLAGGGIYDLTNNAVVPVEGQNAIITATTVFLPVNLTIPDGGTVSLEAYTKIDNNNAPDGGILQFQINAANHGFTADASGSDFETTFAGGDIVGNDFTVDVVATQFTFLTQPSDVVVNAIMNSFQVATTDAFGNVDIDNNLNYIKILFSGTGTMYGTSGLSTNNGICTYTDLYFNTPQTGVHLTANDGNGTLGFSDIPSTNFNILPNSGGAHCADAVSVDVGTHHAIHTLGSGDYDQWYVYHATENGTITVSDCDLTTVDTDLQIIEDNCSGTNFDEVDGNCGSNQETLDFTVVAGTDYYIGWGNWDAAGEEHDWTLSFRKAVNIINAYAVSNDSLVLSYESGLSSVNPADYTLTAISQTMVNFTAATIDATHDSIVYLKAQNNFAINVLRDNINDAYNNASYQFYAGILPISYTNTANAPDTVRQGYNVTLNGVVTANDNYNQVWIQDSDNPKSGVMIYSFSFDSEVSVGDNITIVGQKAFHYGATEIVDPLLINLVSGSTPVAANVNSSDLNYNATQDDPTAEQWEGQLVTVCGIVIDSLDSKNHYEYFGHNSNGDIICFDDDVDYHYGSGFSLTNGSMYSITGVVTYSSGHYKINPRGTADAVETDQTSVVVAPDTQVPDATIDGALAVDSLHAIEAFKFKVTDEGTDGLPTKISQVTIYTGPNNTVDLSGNAIAGGWFDFGDAANPIVVTAEPQFDTDHLIFAVDPETAIIDNGTSKDVILHVWFDPSIADESVLQLTVKADPHGFVADCMNSQFASTFASDVTGGTLTIDTNVGIKDVFANSIRIYPNPSNGVFNITVENNCKLEISDITGRVLNTRTLTGNTSIELNTAGIYFLKFSNDKGSYIQKVIVK